MSEQFKGQVAVISGASRGIGREITLALTQAGAIVVAIARRLEVLEQLVKDASGSPGQVVPCVGDATNENDIARLHSETIQKFGRCDILINNVGVGRYGLVKDFSVEDYDWIMNTNMRSSFLLTRSFLPGMIEQKSGSIVFIGSVAGLRGLPGEAVYCASKFAQHGFAQALDYETREHGVRVSVVAPGATKTDFAIGHGRTLGEPRLEGYSDPESVRDAVMLVLSMPPKTRVMLVSMRPMVEAL